VRAARSAVLLASVFATAFGLSRPARAEPAKAILVARVGGSSVARDRGVTARRGESVEIFVLVRADGRWYGAVDPALVDGRRVAVRPLSELGPATVTWRAVEPRMVHEGDGAADHRRPYTNAVLMGRTHGRWRGYDPIAYFERPLPSARGPRLVVRESRPSDPELDVRGGLGTLRYAARVELAGGAVSTPGAADVEATGIDGRVLRVSYRAGDDLPGWLATYFNVPQVFGSAGGPASHQTDRFVGADCADVVVGALRAAGRRDVAYTSVGGLTRYARAVSDVLLQLEDGRIVSNDEARRPKVLRFGTDVRRGDIVTIDYVGFAGLPRAWDHVGVLGDDDGDGVLDGGDPLYHMGLDRGLTVEPLSAQGLVRLRVLRLRRALAAPPVAV
jgi:hypothetical protein